MCIKTPKAPDPIPAPAPAAPGSVAQLKTNLQDTPVTTLPDGTTVRRRKGMGALVINLPGAAGVAAAAAADSMVPR